MPAENGARLGATLITLFVVGLLIWFVGSVSQIVVLFFVSALMGAYLCAFTDLVSRYTRAPRWTALGIVCVVTTLAMAGLGALLLPPVIQQSQELISSLPEYGRRLDSYLQAMAVRYPVMERAAFGSGGESFAERLVGEASDFVRGSVFPYLTAGGKVAVELFSVFAMALYFARDPDSYREGFISLVPPKVRHIARTALIDLAKTIRAWVTGQLLAMTFLAVLTAVGLWFLNVPYALAFGVFTGVVAVVPFFGTIVSTLLPALFVLANGALGQSFAVVLLGVAVHLVEANIVAPLIFQERIQLPPVLTILSILVAAKVLGVLGLIVAVPLLATTMVIVRHVLISEVYGDVPVGSTKPAVLVPTQEHRFSYQSLKSPTGAQKST